MRLDLCEIREHVDRNRSGIHGGVMFRRSSLVLALLSLILVGTASGATADTVTSHISYNRGTLTAAAIDCDPVYFICGVGTFDGQPATFAFYPPTDEGQFVGDCFQYTEVDEVVELQDSSGSLLLRHTVTICPPNPNWWKNQGFVSFGNPWDLESTWTVVSGTGVYADASGDGSWTAFWAGASGTGKHSGDIATE
jgi:hypothetical protein